MSDEPRATVALVSEKIDGLRELTKAGFSDTQRQLNDLNPLPERVVKLEAEKEALEQRVEELESERASNREWKRGPLLFALASAIALIANIVLTILTH